MRKIAFFIAAFIVMGANVLGQTIHDGGFDSCWVEKTTTNGKPKFWDFKDDYFFITLNADLYTLPAVLGKAPLTAFRETTDVYEGRYSLKLVSNTMIAEEGSDDGTVFLPGAMGNINIDIANVYCDLGKPFRFRPDTLKGYFKYIPVKGDSAAIEIQLQKADKKTVLGSGKEVIKETVSAWTPFSIPVVYTSAATPDEIVIVFSASAAYDFTDINTLLACKGQVGSALYLDEIKLAYAGVGIEELLTPAVKLSIYPNPSTDKVHLQLAKQTDGTVVVYDCLTRKVGEYPVCGSQMEIDVREYAVGAYLINVMENNRVIGSGRFLKE